VTVFLSVSIEVLELELLTACCIDITPSFMQVPCVTDSEVETTRICLGHSSSGRVVKV
jgi:hypothetical protein